MFIVKKQDKIVLIDNDLERLTRTLAFMPDLAECQIEETLRPIEQMNGEYVYADTAGYVQWKNEQIKKYRASLYVEHVDPLHAQKNKDTIMGEWDEQKEQDYIAEVKRLTIKIREENPYIELPVDNGVIYV